MAEQNRLLKLSGWDQIIITIALREALYLAEETNYSALRSEYGLAEDVALPSAREIYALLKRVQKTSPKRS